MMVARRPRDHRALFWAASPFLLLGGLLGTQLLLLGDALDDPSFAVEDDYYEKALTWDARMAQERENARLGWQVSLSTEGFGPSARVIVKLRDRAGAALEGAEVRLEAFPNARASRVRSVELVEGPPGAYAAQMLVERAGLWEFRVEARRRLDRFSHVLRRDVSPGDAHKPGTRAREAP